MRGSGGVGIFNETDLPNMLKTFILDDTKDGIIWIKFKGDLCSFVICVCYMPPKYSKYCD